ncbi:uncharacterized protein LOC110612766 isoform X2 [Manihot esculenta]|uniref:uncharacterized protein LOC110612766 isoform X2 n=1 Tax=Manihot esculenta TaxID=3983 RepID=UPI000B5D6DF6|nr:uncharacterized protein LOC110612766 isoform X2 [Manihot esculenta]
MKILGKQTMAVAAMAVSKLCYSNSPNRDLLVKPTKKNLMGSPKFFLNAPNLSSNATRRVSSPIQASNSPEESSSTNNSNGISQEDLKYLWKLGGGSVAGAALIKYGSIIFPEITKPNILLALTMVTEISCETFLLISL